MPRPPLDPGAVDRDASGCEDRVCDPRRLAGRIGDFSDGVLTLRTTSGRVISARVDADTTVVCPPRSAVEAGRLLNPPPPSLEGSTEAEEGDRYLCSQSELQDGAAIAGATVGRDPSGQRQWLMIAVNRG